MAAGNVKVYVPLGLTVALIMRAVPVEAVSVVEVFVQALSKKSRAHPISW